MTVKQTVYAKSPLLRLMGEVSNGEQMNHCTRIQDGNAKQTVGKWRNVGSETLRWQPHH